MEDRHLIDKEHHSYGYEGGHGGRRVLVVEVSMVERGSSVVGFSPGEGGASTYDRK